jgi:hypothetical protein
MDWIKVGGFVEQGHQIASGLNPNSPYPAGALELQRPFFKELGLDLGSFYLGTLNVSIRPLTFRMTNPQFTFKKVNWTPYHPPEDFSFSGCKIVVRGHEYGGWVYYPHPETKETHFQDPSIVEVIGPYIAGIGYGDEVKLVLNGEEVEVGS